MAFALSTLNNLVNTITKLPHNFFWFDGMRDDAIGTEYQSWNATKIAQHCIEAHTAKLYKYKMYQTTSSSVPFAVKTNNNNDHIIGRIMKYNKDTFDKTLKLAQKCKTQSYYTQIVVDVYLENDIEKKEGIPAIIYVKKHKNLNLDHCHVIESNDWLQRRLLNTELKLSRSNRIRLSKGGPTINYLTKRSKCIEEWKTNIKYKKGDLIVMDVKKRWGRIIDNYGYWAMCMNPHQSSELNKPQKNDIFTDLVMNIIPFIKMYLIEHVQGFNNEVCSFIINYCYKTNNFWWNGCKNDDESQRSFGGTNCGNLVTGIPSESLCKVCLTKKINVNKKNDNVDNVETAAIKGAVISLNKIDQTIKREYVGNRNENNDEKEEKQTEMDKNMILRTDIKSKIERQKICNLLTRNFHEGMTSLITGCIMNNDKMFVYKNEDGKDIEVNIGDTKLWGLYNIDDKNGNNEELICGLLWRFVHGKTKFANKSKLMFETLFLSTYENARFNHYGQKMAKQIELYCISNGYDLCAVAAVPVHGESFWKSNGFEMKYPAANLNEQETEQKDKESTRKDLWLRRNMLVFDDTPLFVKYLN